MACEHQFLRAHPVTGKRLFGLLETMASRLDNFVMDNPWVPCRFGDLVAAIRQHPHSLIGLEREIGDHELRKLKALCDQHFDFYAPLYEPLRIRVTQLVKYRAELTVLLSRHPPSSPVFALRTQFHPRMVKRLLRSTIVTLKHFLGGRSASAEQFFASSKKMTDTSCSLNVSTKFSVRSLSWPCSAFLEIWRTSGWRCFNARFRMQRCIVPQWRQGHSDV